MLLGLADVGKPWEVVGVIGAGWRGNGLSGEGIWRGGGGICAGFEGVSVGLLEMAFRNVSEAS